MTGKQDPMLENILEQMRETEARRADLERQRTESQHHLREKIAGRYQGSESIEALQSKIRELEKKTELQMVRHEELSLELTSLKRSRSRSQNALDHTDALVNSGITTTTWPLASSDIERIICKIEQNSTERLLHDVDQTHSSIMTQQPSISQSILRSSMENLLNSSQHHHSAHQHALNLGMSSQISHYAGSPMPLTPMMSGCSALTPNGFPYHYSEPIPPAPSSLSTSQSQPVFQPKLQQYQQQYLDISSSLIQNNTLQKQQQQMHSHYSGNQYQENYPHTQTYQKPINKQQQQLKHSTSSSYLTSVSQTSLPHYSQSGLSSQTYQHNGINKQNTTYANLSMTSHPNITYSSIQPTNYGTQLVNYSVPQTNLSQTLPSYSVSSYHSTITGLTNVTQSIPPFSTGTNTFSTPGTSYTNVGTNVFGISGVTTGSGSLLQTIGDPLQAMQQLSVQSQANQLQQQAIIQQIQQSLRDTSPTPTNTTSVGHHFLGPRQMPKIPTHILANPLDRLSVDSTLILEGQVDMLDIPGKGRCYVYIARFTYEPFQHSPNENPEAELPVQGGDYLLVWGQPDEDGFLDAETLDGRRGLVPANFVQKLVGDDLLEFHQAVLGLRDVDDAVSTNIPQDIDLELAALEEGNRNRQAELSAYAELDDIADEEEQEPPVPAPQHLTLERQLNKSVLIGWTAPDNPHQLESYHVYVDGVLKVTVKTTERTRALVEGVDSNRPHRISVRSVTHSRRTSRDAACTMVIGKDMVTGPTAVRASNVTATSAIISWLPSNSNHQHVVCVNNVEVRTVKPGVYRHTITGLAPSTIYRVTVKAKNLRATHFEDQNTQMANNQACHIHFKTLPKGLPDPPVDIQVEAGPQDGTLLVTWQPVALNSSTVTGYAVYADGKKVTDVDSPTGDHALVDIHKLMGLNPKHITVRTKSRESQSGDSCATAIPCNVLRGGPVHIQHQQIHLHGDPSHQMNLQMQDQSSVAIGPTGFMVDSSQQKIGEIGTSGQRYVNSQTSTHMRRHYGTRVDAHGQIIIETDENLSDKEIYPNQSISQTCIQKGKGSMYKGSHTGLSQSGSHRLSGVQQVNKRPRWFIALFDYDPTTMSPNPDACEEELRFSENDIIKVYEDKDADGFYWGECRGRRGYIPHNMVEEIKDPNQISQLQGGQQNVNSIRGQGSNDRWGDIYANIPVKKMIALYDYNPQELSPNVDAEQVELSFQTGNEIYVYGEMDDDGFFMGELDGVRGLVPSNFLTEAPGPAQSEQSGQNHSQPLSSNRRIPGQGQGPGVRGPPPPLKEIAGHRRNKDSRQQQQPLMNNQQPYHLQQYQQNNPPHLAYQQANHHSYTTVTTSNQHGSGHPPNHGGVVGPHGTHQLGQISPHIQQGRGKGVVSRAGNNNIPGGSQSISGQLQQQQQNQSYQQQQNQQGQAGVQVTYQQSSGVYQLSNQTFGPHIQQQVLQSGEQQQQQQYGQSNQGGIISGIQDGAQSSKPIRGIPAVIPTTQSLNSQQQQSGAAPNLMQKFTEITGTSAGGDILSKGKELIFMKFGLGKT